MGQWGDYVCMSFAAVEETFDGETSPTVETAKDMCRKQALDVMRKLGLNENTPIEWMCKIDYIQHLHDPGDDDCDGNIGHLEIGDPKLTKCMANHWKSYECKEPQKIFIGWKLTEQYLVIPKGFAPMGDLRDG